MNLNYIKCQITAILVTFFIFFSLLFILGPTIVTCTNFIIYIKKTLHKVCNGKVFVCNNGKKKKLN